MPDHAPTRDATADTAIPGPAEVRIYEQRLPDFIEAELERLYQNVFTSLARLRALGVLEHCCAYVVREHGVVTCLLLFHRRGHRLHVLNEAIGISAAQLQVFAATIFQAYRAVALIRFGAIAALPAPAALAYPHQRHNCLEDIVLTLPPSAALYLERLGKSTRASLKRYEKKIRAELSGFTWDIVPGAAVSAAQLAELVELSGARMASKRQVSAHTAAKTALLLQLLRSYGVVGLARRDGQLCAGVACTRVGAHVYMHIVAHDPAYDRYRLGKICCYWSICDAIAGGAAEYHFLSGRYDYKFHLLGVQREFERLVLYRSAAARLRHWPLWALTALRGHARRARRWWRSR